VSGSLSDLPNYVTDAFLRIPEKPFTPENTVFGRYTFLPWTRTGIAASVSAPAVGVRASVDVVLPVEGGPAPVLVPQKLVVRGPGDVLAISARQVIRRYPVPDATRAEDTFLAHIEFDRPDFPWIFTPAAPTLAGTRLPPWVVLVVLREPRAELTPASGGLPARVRTMKSELQPLDDSWAWAHAQLVGPKDPDAQTASVADRLTPAYADLNLSRLVCPRRLQSGQGYLACVVPAFDAGRRAGLADTSAPPTLEPAWTRAADGSDANEEVVLPVYTSWSFSTGPDGDFRSLAELLQAVPAPWQVGRRLLDVASPRGGLPDLPADAAGRLQTVRGPLVSPQLPDAGSADPVEVAAAAAETAAWPQPETELLRAQLADPDRLAGLPGALGPDELPLIGPELYARYQAAATRVETDRDGDWFGQLNLRPVDRVTAGLGTRVVQRDQEALMQSAWAQVGEVDDVNAQLRRAQLARYTMGSVHERHLSVLDDGSLLQTTRLVHGRVASDATVTVRGKLDDSSTAATTTTAAFRRITRARGPLARYVAAGTGSGTGSGGGVVGGVVAGLVADDGTARDHQRPYADLDGVGGVSEVAARAADPTIVAAALGLGEADAETCVAALLDHGRKLAQVPALSDLLTPGAVRESTPDPAYRLSDTSGERVLAAVLTAVEQGADDPAALVRWVQLCGALSRAGTDTAARAQETARALSHQLLRLKQPIGDGQIPPDGRLEEQLAFGSQVPPQASTLALTPIATDLVDTTLPGTPVRPAFPLDSPGLLERLQPATTATVRVLGRLGGRLPDWLPVDWFADGQVQPIMAAPVFVRPMYQALADYDREWLLPGLAQMQQPDLVTALLTNAEFVEAFLVGLSSEMGRELLWRGYPTDQRGTYFRRFWNGDVDELQQDIHRFAATGLGTHLLPTLTGRVALLVRGQLIRRYPNAVALALRAGGTDGTGHPIFIDPASDPSSMATVLFTGHLAPDIVIVGFDLQKSQVLTEPWWFVIAEHPTGPRFGLAAPPPPAPPATRETLAWGQLPIVGVPTVAGVEGAGFLSALSTVDVQDPTAPGGRAVWGQDAATNAHLLLIDPVRAAFDARTLLGPTGALS
jgi:hypothetical protein